MQFDKNFAVQKLNEMIAQHPDALDGCGKPEIENYAESAPWAVGLTRYNELDEDVVIQALICFDFQWGEEFRQMNGRAPSTYDWIASWLDRANAFADALGALKPYDNQLANLRGEYQAALAEGRPADGDFPPVQEC